MKRILVVAVFLAGCGSQLSERVLLATASLVNSADQAVARRYRESSRVVRTKAGGFTRAEWQAAMAPLDAQVDQVAAARVLLLDAGRVVKTTRRADTDLVALSSVSSAVRGAAELAASLPEFQALRAAMCAQAGALMRAQGLADPCPLYQGGAR